MIDFNSPDSSDFELAPYQAPGHESSQPPSLVPMPAPAQIVSQWGATVMSDTARVVAETESAALLAHGIGSSEQYFATGTALADSGHAALEEADKAFRAMPPPSTALADFKDTIAKELRSDQIVNLRDYRINSFGRLSALHSDGGHAIEENAYRQLGQAAEATNINAGLESSVAPLTRRMRNRVIGGKDSSYALVSANARQGYTICDGNQVADLVLNGLRDANMLAGAKTAVTYEEGSTRYSLRTIVQAPIDIAAFRGVGRVHQIYMDVTGGDDGMASVKGSMGAIRIRCLNASLSRAEGSTWRVVHKGGMVEISRLVASMAGKFAAVATDMQEVWARAAGNYYLDADGGRLSPTEAITRLVAHGYVPTGELSAEGAIEAYTAAWRAEDSPESAAGIIMAVQRAAHETNWRTKWGESDIEVAASDLLYQPVYVLDEAN